METVTTFEYTEFEYEITDGKERLKDEKLYLKKETIEKLERLNESLKFAVIGRRKIKVLNYAGVIGLGDVRLEILPKFLKRRYDKGLLKSDEVEGREKILSNLLEMLKRTRRLNVKETDIAMLDKEDDFFEIFVYLFTKNLLNLLKCKVDAGYVRKNEELNFVRGKIDVKRYINPARFHRVPCVFYERSMDTPINRTLKYVCYLLSKKVSPENYRLLKQIIAILDPVTLTPVSADYIRKITFNRLNKEFKPFIDFCEVVLRSSTLSLQGSQIEFFSILFPMEKLFEEFIAEVIRTEDLHKKVFEDCVLQIQQEKKEKDRKYFVTKPKKMFELIPDIVIKAGNERFVIDTKYKLLDPEDRKLGVSQQDLYQIFAYCKALKAEKALLLYPKELNENDNKEIEENFTLIDGTKVFVRTISLSYDLKEKWNDFVNELKAILKCLKYKQTQVLVGKET